MGYKLELTDEQIASFAPLSGDQIRDYLAGRRDELYQQRVANLVSNLHDRHPLNLELAGAVDLLRVALASLNAAKVVRVLDQFESRLGLLYEPPAVVQAGARTAEPSPPVATGIGEFRPSSPPPFKLADSPVFGADEPQQEWELDNETHQYHPAAASTDASASVLEAEDEDEDEDDDDSELEDNEPALSGSDDSEWELDPETHQYHPA